MKLPDVGVPAPPKIGAIPAILMVALEKAGFRRAPVCSQVPRVIVIAVQKTRA